MTDQASTGNERGLMLVFANATSDAEVDEFNSWYDDTHLPELLAVPGIVAATRYQLSADQMVEADPLGRRFLALYEIEATDLKTVRDTILATSSDRTHSATLELDPLPITMILEQISPRQCEKTT